jgi:hypothetical protein
MNIESTYLLDNAGWLRWRRWWWWWRAMAARDSNDTSNSNSKDGEDLSELHLYRRLEVILKKKSRIKFYY